MGTPVEKWFSLILRYFSLNKSINMIYVYGQDYLQFPLAYIGNDDVICNI